MLKLARPARSGMAVCSPDRDLHEQSRVRVLDAKFRAVQLRDQYSGASELGMLQVINFALSTSIAVLAAFAAQYGSALPDALDWKAAVAAFMFGFGLDQIRDTVDNVLAVVEHQHQLSGLQVFGEDGQRRQARPLAQATPLSNR